MKLMLNGKEVTGMGHYVMAGDIKDATAEDSNVLSGKAFYNNNGKREGTMPNRGGMSAELPAGGSVSIPEGYHNGEGVVRAQDLASQTAGTAAAANIEAGYTAWVNGEMVEGKLVPGVDSWEIVNLNTNANTPTTFNFSNGKKPKLIIYQQLGATTGPIWQIFIFPDGSKQLVHEANSGNAPMSKVTVTISDTALTLTTTQQTRAVNSVFVY